MGAGSLPHYDSPHQQFEFSIHTECTYCGQPIHFEMDSDLNYNVLEQDAASMIFARQVNFDRLEAPNIIDAFWRKSVCVWSQKHAREDRRTTKMVRGTYLTMSQAIFVPPIIQGGIFAFPRSRLM